MKIAESKGQVFQWVVVVFAFGGSHELLLAVEDYMIGGWSYSSVTTSLNYIVWLSAFLILAAVFGSSYQRRVLFYSTLLIVACYLIQLPVNYTGFVVGSSITGFQPTEYFMSPVTNFFEVFNWLFPLLVFLLPERTLIRLPWRNKK